MKDRGQSCPDNWKMSESGSLRMCGRRLTDKAATQLSSQPTDNPTSLFEDGLEHISLAHPMLSMLNQLISRMPMWMVSA